jgi:hypothetical protein
MNAKLKALAVAVLLALALTTQAQQRTRRFELPAGIVVVETQSLAAPGHEVVAGDRGQRRARITSRLLSAPG